jgi:transposase
MIQITPQMRILVAVETVDFRAGIDTLVRLCRERLQADPFAGGLFVFRSRRETAIRVLGYDGQGFWLCHKRLSSGRFRFWPHSATQAARVLEAPELQVLLMAGDPGAVRTAPAWRQLTAVG